MPRHAHLQPSAYHLAAPSSPVVVVMLHGFTSSPGEMRVLAEHIHRHGYDVHAPLLPGHGTHERELNRIDHAQWTTAVQEVVQHHAHTRLVVVVGQSLGGALALHEASRGVVAGVVALAPALQMPRMSALARWIAPVVPTFPKFERRLHGFVDSTGVDALWSYESTPLRAVQQIRMLAAHTTRKLPSITCPVLLCSAGRDNLLGAHACDLALRHLRSDVMHRHFARSGHVLPLDAQRQEVGDAITQWLAALPRSPPQGSPA
jgi:carboxylesterase